MKFFIDTANVTEIREAKEMGLIDGVTTNPTLIAKEKRPFEEIVREICALMDGPISLEVLSQEAGGMVTEALVLSQYGPQVVVKVPLTKEGLKATQILSREGIKTNLTLAFSPSQAILAAKAGATYISPFVGRLDDISQPGMDLVEQIVTIYNNYGFTTEVIVASIRNPLHVVEAALIGADIATIPFKVIEQLIKHPLTDAGVKSFLDDWQKVPKSK